MQLLPEGLFLLWLVGALTLCALQVVRIALLELRLRAARPAPAGVTAECAGLARRFGLRRCPRVQVVDEAISPFLWFLGPPRVILSRELACRSAVTLLRSVLAHELTHIRRRDHWISCLELVAGWFYWWLPTFWWARQEMRRAADQAADAGAVWAVGSRETYAESLLETVELLNAPGPSVPALGRGLGDREMIARRLTMIMRERLCHRLSWSARLGVALLGLLVLPAAPERIVAQESTPGVVSGTTLPRNHTEERLQRVEEKLQRVMKELRSLRSLIESQSNADARSGTSRTRSRSYSFFRGSDARRESPSDFDEPDTTVTPEGVSDPSATSGAESGIGPFLAADDYGGRTLRALQLDLEKQIRDLEAQHQQRLAELKQQMAQLEAEHQLRLQQLHRLLNSHTPATPVAAAVEAVDHDQQLVVFSAGADDGVKKGQRFDIYRQGKLVGKVEVLRVYADLAGAKILSTTREGRIRRGDKAMLYASPKRTQTEPPSRETKSPR